MPDEPVEATVTSQVSETQRTRGVDLKVKGSPAQVAEILDSFLASMARHFPNAIPQQAPDVVSPTAGSSQDAG